MAAPGGRARTDFRIRCNDYTIGRNELSWLLQVGVPELENPTSELLLNFINHLNEQRPFAAPVSVIR